MPITLLQEIPEARFGHVGSTFVSVWFNELTIASLDTLELHHRALHQRHGLLTFISVAASANKIPTADVRARMQRGLPELQAMRRANIIAVTAKGVGAIITRTFMATMSLISSEKLIIVASLEQAAEAARALPNQDEATRTNLALGEELAAFLALPH